MEKTSNELKQYLECITIFFFNSNKKKDVGKLKNSMLSISKINKIMQGYLEVKVNDKTILKMPNFSELKITPASHTPRMKHRAFFIIPIQIWLGNDEIINFVVDKNDKIEVKVILPNDRLIKKLIGLTTYFFRYQAKINNKCIRSTITQSESRQTDIILV